MPEPALELEPGLESKAPLKPEPASGKEDTYVDIPCPYVEGARFTLEITTPDGSIYQAEAHVTKAFSPYTVSPVMKVILGKITPMQSVIPGIIFDPPTEVILKVYDHRFSRSLRRFYQIGAPTPEIQAEHAAYIASGHAPTDPADCFRSDGDDSDGSDGSDEEGFEFSDALFWEHYIFLITQPYFSTECAVYEHLSELQGSDIPTLYGKVRFLGGQSAPNLDLSKPGLLLEFIPGTNVEFVDPKAVDIDFLVTQCMRIVKRYTEMGVLNEDVRFENFIAKSDGSGVVMIDLAQCRLRKPGEDDHTWKKAKWRVDEEGAIGYVAQKKWGWKFVHSFEWAVPASEDD